MSDQRTIKFLRSACLAVGVIFSGVWLLVLLVCSPAWVSPGFVGVDDAIPVFAFAIVVTAVIAAAGSRRARTLRAVALLGSLLGSLGVEMAIIAGFQRLSDFRPEFAFFGGVAFGIPLLCAALAAEIQRRKSPEAGA